MGTENGVQFERECGEMQVGEERMRERGNERRRERKREKEGMRERGELGFVRNGWGDLMQGRQKARALSPLGPLSVFGNSRGWQGRVLGRASTFSSYSPGNTS
jgi:hypothetical protein